MEFYYVNFSYIYNKIFEEYYLSISKQGGGKLILYAMSNARQAFTFLLKDEKKLKYNHLRPRCGNYLDMFEALQGNFIKLKY